MIHTTRIPAIGGVTAQATEEATVVDMGVMDVEAMKATGAAVDEAAHRQAGEAQDRNAAATGVVTEAVTVAAILVMALLRIRLHSTTATVHLHLQLVMVSHLMAARLTSPRQRIPAHHLPIRLHLATAMMLNPQEQHLH